jgi:hypothetical protein
MVRVIQHLFSISSFTKSIIEMKSSVADQSSLKKILVQLIYSDEQCMNTAKCA